jgi:hypothetical protein
MFPGSGLTDDHHEKILAAIERRWRRIAVSEHSFRKGGPVMDFFYLEYIVLAFAIVYFAGKMREESRTDRDQSDHSNTVIKKGKRHTPHNVGSTRKL